MLDRVRWDMQRSSTHGECRDNKLRPDVCRGSPKLLVHPLKHEPELYPKGRSERRQVLGRGTSSSSRQLLLHPGKLLPNGLSFRTLTPHIRPIVHRRHARDGTDDLKHPFGGVGIRRARVGPVALEVPREGLRVLTDLAEVDGSAAGCEEEQSVELLE